MTDKHYLPATTVAGGNKAYVTFVLTPSLVSIAAVDETVINIIGYFKPNTPNGETLPDELFAIDWTKRALMVSQDGVTFKSCDPGR